MEEGICGERGKKEVGEEELGWEGWWIELPRKGKGGSARFVAWREFPTGEVMGGVVVRFL